MQKKTMYTVVGVIVVILLAIGGYALFHKSPTSTTTNASGTTATTTKTSTTGDVVQTRTASGTGSYLADANGNALYTYGSDTNGVSNCTGSCIANWPAYAPTSTSATLPTNVTIISRSDGTKQYAYKGLPLYTFSSDPAGQVTGNGVANFSVAKP